MNLNKNNTIVRKITYYMYNNVEMFQVSTFYEIQLWINIIQLAIKSKLDFHMLINNKRDLTVTITIFLNCCMINV